MSSVNDGSESVDQFLARIASVKEGRDEANEERKRRMEEEFLKNRTERQARRLERARSLSPSKTGPSRTNPLSTTPASNRENVTNPPVDFSPSNATLSRSNAVRTLPTTDSRTTPIDSPATNSNTPSPVSNMTSLSRSGTLSWQQRPAEREGSLGRPRPLSTIATVRSRPLPDQAEPASPKEQSRSEIAAALGQKDPAWFRQTQDRGLNSAAFRKNQVEDTPTPDPGVKSMRLPGLSREGTPEARVASPAQRSPAQERIPQLYSDKTVTKPSSSPRPAGAASPSVATGDAAASDVQEFSGRSPSPTKGLGGFVQSAMMRRSDSVSKRWTVQAGSGLQRGDSVAGARPRSGLQATYNRPVSQVATVPAVESSTPVPIKSKGIDSSAAYRPDTTSDEPNEPRDEKSNPSLTGRARPNTPPQDRAHLTRSPSKGLESKRWSPTKSSWLESTLLANQEPPKLSPKKEEQPQWMVNLQRSKSIKEQSPERAATKDGRAAQHASSVKERVALSKVQAISDNGNQMNSSDDLQSQSEETARVVDSIRTPKDTSPEKVESLTEFEQAESRTEISETAQKQPPSLKPKPQTPPKTDFRSTLRSRATTNDNDKGAEPEFKAMFGKLKPAQTKNYVAPDTLKTNILSGKAALSITGGPQKTQRVDEFKESILQKKEAMKASANEKQQTAPARELPKVESPLPEALQRRKTLHKATPSVTKTQDEFKAKEVTSQSKPKPVLSTKPKLDGASKEQASLLDDNGPPVIQPAKPGDSNTKSKQSNIEHSKPIQISRPISSIARTMDSPAQSSAHVMGQDLPTIKQKPKEQRNETSKPKSPLPTPAIATKVTPQIPQSGAPVSGKLASRLNPNLAALISRGNAPRTVDDTNLPSNTSDVPTSVVGQDATSGELTHMTKGRARGPKRRAPKTQTAPSKTIPPMTQAQQIIKPVEASVKVASTPASPTKSVGQLKNAFSTQDSEPAHNIRSDDVKRAPLPVQVWDDNVDRRLNLVEKPSPKIKPVVASKSPELRRVSTPPISKTTESKLVPPKDFEIATDKTQNSISNAKTSMPVPTMQSPESAPSPRPLTPSKSRINTPKQPGSEKPILSTPLKGLGLQSRSSGETATSSSNLVRPQSPEKTTGNTAFVTGFFSASNMPSAKDKAEFDTQALLEASQADIEKINTINNTIWQLGGDGKKISLPPQQEHILYEDCMYLMIHTFEAGGSKTTEVYLWYGDKVPDAAIEDVQIFCKKDAREHNARLELLKQGKEPARFFQALGGIVITRRSKDSALYMLCGRKHLGHIAFDEVDFAIESLCSGFPYLISAKFGSLFLWKGKGSAVDEVGCARLIGMDLGLTGEIEEVDEGQESDSFWDAFSDPRAKRHVSPSWQQRNTHAAYPCALYRVEHERPKSAGGFWGLRSASPPKASTKAAIEALVPFSQRDLEQGNVYILDAYCSVYVVLDTKSALRAAECTTALHLAQEIAMLSPAIQGRTLLPSCYVSFGELPIDATNCFRKWSSTRRGRDEQQSTCMKLEDVMQALGL